LNSLNYLDLNLINIGISDSGALEIVQAVQELINLNFLKLDFSINKIGVDV